MADKILHIFEKIRKHNPGNNNRSDTVDSVQKNEKNTYGEVICPTDLNKYHEFKTKEEATRWGYDLYEEWGKNHKAIYERIASFYCGFSSMPTINEPVARYCGYDFEEMNEYLRKDYIFDGKLTQESNYRLHYILDLTVSIFSTPRVDKDIIVYRQVSDKMINELIDLNKQGRPYTEKGFLSTSLVKNVCIKNCGHKKKILKIYVPSRFYALYANVVCKRDEQELLFPPFMGLELIKYPYIDGDVEIYEVILLHTKL